MPTEPTADTEDVLAGLDDRLNELRGRLLSGLDDRLNELRGRLDTMRRRVGELDGASRPAAPTADRETQGYVSLAPRPGAGVDPVARSAAHLLYERVCRRLRILPVSLSDGVLTLATADPGDRFAQNVAHALTGKPLEVVAASPDEIDAAIDRVFASPPQRDPAPYEPVSDGGSPIRPEEPADTAPSRARWAIGIGIALIVAAGVASRRWRPRSQRSRPAG
jgi:hypothetical protein